MKWFEIAARRSKPLQFGVVLVALSLALIVFLLLRHESTTTQPEQVSAPPGTQDGAHVLAGTTTPPRRSNEALASTPPQGLPRTSGPDAAAAQTRRAWVDIRTRQVSAAALLRSAMAAKDPDALVVALRAVSACLGTSTWTEDFLMQMTRSRIAAANGSAGWIASADEVLAANREVRKFCGDFSTPENAALLMAARDSNKPGVINDLAAQPSPRSSGAGYWPQETRQAAITVLLDPVRYAYAMDYVLRAIDPRLLDPAWASLSAIESDLVRHLVYQELTGDRAADSIRNMSFCVQQSICDSSLAQLHQGQSGERVLEASRFLVSAIRSQRWTTMGL